jgi:hypothetical protein
MNTLSSPKTLRATLYSGIALVVISMLFLGREAETSPALVKIMLAAATPAFFYITGGWVYRHLNAPLAAPGIVATGAWLVAVELVHFYDQRHLLPDFARTYYWLFAAIFAAVIITLTGHKVRIWLLVPLVPLAQINATWAVMGATGLDIAWWSVFSFILVLVWWEVPLHAEEWRRVYRVSAVLLEVFLLIFSYWLPAQTANSMLITWGTCALLVAILSLRHGWVNLGPLAIVLLALAVAWGFPAGWWSPIWLVIGIGTVIFIERLARRDDEANTLALEMSTALAVLLSGASALLIELLEFSGGASLPMVTVLVLLGSGGLMIWLGKRRELTTAIHAGLWLLAAAWAEIYHMGLSDSGTFGLWLSLLAVIALLTERLLISASRQKHKGLSSIQEAFIRWPLADLVVGLSAIIVIWTAMTAMSIPANDPVIVVTTLAVVIGVWIAAGLLYRMPALLHVALWLAPMPYALLLLWNIPALYRLPLLGVAWQFLAIIYLVFGHLLFRHRPAMLAPFFIAGYALLGFGLTLTIPDPMLVVVGLGLVIIVSFATSIIILAGAHPAWETLVIRLVPPHERPYAYRQVRQAFVFLTAWLAVIWLYLMLGLAQFPAPQQGIVLVLMSSAWIMLGRLLPRLQGMVGWPVYAAGWFMWLTGLLLVFFSPPEAMITAIFGLALSAEALHRSKALHWMPVFILQMLFSVLQIAWMLRVPGHSLLLAVTMGLSLAGMWYARTNRQAGQITALTGITLSAAIWTVFLNPVSTFGMILLALVALWMYRRWQVLLAFYAPVIILAVQFGLGSNWRLMLLAGGAHIMIGAALVGWLRPRDFRTFTRTFIDEQDWASPFLWTGALSVAVGLIQGWSTPEHLILPVLVVAAMVGLCTIWLRVPRLPYVPLALGGLALLLQIATLGKMSFSRVGTPILLYSIVMAAAALALHTLGLAVKHQPRPFARLRWLVWWLRPLTKAGGVLAILSGSLLFVAPLYDPNRIGLAVDFLLFGLIALVIYWKVGRPAWMIAALAAAWLAWFQLLAAFGLSGLQWHTIPFGILLLGVARVFDRFDPRLTEILAIDLLMFGSMMDMLEHGWLSLATVGLLAQLAGLAIYGYRQQRPVPFISVLIIVTGGVVFVLFRVNSWLIPLAAGLLLLGVAVLLEVRHEQVKRWLVFWIERLDMESLVKTKDANRLGLKAAGYVSEAPSMALVIRAVDGPCEE